jgi:hypothetical protein
LIIGVASVGDTARDAGNKRLRAADAFHIKAAVTRDGVGGAGYLGEKNNQDESQDKETLPGQFTAQLGSPDSDCDAAPAATAAIVKATPVNFMLAKE